MKNWSKEKIEAKRLIETTLDRGFAYINRNRVQEVLDIFDSGLLIKEHWTKGINKRWFEISTINGVMDLSEGRTPLDALAGLIKYEPWYFKAV